MGRWALYSIMVVLAVLGSFLLRQDEPGSVTNRASVLNFTVKDIDGNSVHLNRFQGSVILIVNTASYCGNTPQYKSLQTLYDRFKGKGFVVLAFPSNDFGNQEPGSNREIKEFCSVNYDITFPVFSKVSVKGDSIAPLYRHLTDRQTNPEYGGEIEWNFAKFLVGRDGKIVDRFPAGEDPLSENIVKAIDGQLKRK